MYSSAFVAGWGVHDRGGAPSNTLKAAELTVIPAGKSRACSGQVGEKIIVFYVGDYRKHSLFNFHISGLFRQAVRCCLPPSGGQGRGFGLPGGLWLANGDVGRAQRGLDGARPTLQRGEVLLRRDACRIHLSRGLHAVDHGRAKFEVIFQKMKAEFLVK